MAHFDVVVLGCGPAGERAAIQAARAGRRVAVVERANVVGGNRVNWGTIPSKTLRESALFFHQLTRNRLHGIRYEVSEDLTVPDFTFRERVVVQRELELINESLGRYAIEVIQGHGRLVNPHAVAVTTPAGGQPHLLTGDFIVIATGSRPNRPADVPYDGETVFDSETILHLPRMPRSMIVLGAGVVGVEYASIFAALGLDVTLVDTRDRLLPYLDREVVGILTQELRRLGIVILHSDRYTKIEPQPDRPPRVRCHTRAGRHLEADVLLYCVGRDGNTDDIGLDTIGVKPNSYGLIEVNEHFQTAHPHVYAVGDVIGYPALASTSMEQGRQAIRNAYGIPGPKLRTERLPFAIYAIPEVSYVGDTEEMLKEKGIPYVAGRGHYEMNPKGQIVGAPGGLVKLLFERDSLELRGVHIIGHTASELIHTGQAFVDARADASHIAETLYNYPTFSDMYRHAALVALLGQEPREPGERTEGEPA